MFQHYFLGSYLLVIISYVLKRGTAELNGLIPHIVGKIGDSALSLGTKRTFLYTHKRTHIFLTL